MQYSYNCCIAYMKVVKKVDPMSSRHKDFLKRFFFFIFIQNDRC